MKKFLLAILLTLMSANVFALDKCFTGSWYNPIEDGQGINVEVLEGQTIAFFYTFSEFGPAWYLFQGPAGDMDAWGVIKTSDSPWNTDKYKVGSGIIEALDDNHIIFSYSFSIDIALFDPESDIEVTGTPWCLHSGCEDRVIYTRLTTPIACE